MGVGGWTGGRVGGQLPSARRSALTHAPQPRRQPRWYRLPVRVYDALAPYKIRPMPRGWPRVVCGVSTFQPVENGLSVASASNFPATNFNVGECLWCFHYQGRPAHLRLSLSLVIASRDSNVVSRAAFSRASSAQREDYKLS